MTPRRSSPAPPKDTGGSSEEGAKTFSSMDDLPPKVSLDRTKFNQILDNMSNALKHTIKGRVSIDCDFDYGESILRVSVEDTGLGIPEEEQGGNFDVFFQGSTSMRGIGIGLNIVSVLCKLLGGYIEVLNLQ